MIVELLRRRASVRRFQDKPIPEAVLQDILEAGSMPLPPYIKRADRPEDREHYQTMFAADGASAAVTTSTSGSDCT